jgi:hypothetical protein
VLAGARQAQQGGEGAPTEAQLAGSWTGLSHALMQLATL